MREVVDSLVRLYSLQFCGGCEENERVVIGKVWQLWSTLQNQLRRVFCKASQHRYNIAAECRHHYYSYNISSPRTLSMTARNAGLRNRQTVED